MGDKEVLLENLANNLYDKSYILDMYGERIDNMRAYSMANDIREELAAAFNSKGDLRKLRGKDFDGYSIIHTLENIQSYEQKYGLKTMAFIIGIPKKNWDHIKQKLKQEKWIAGVYFGTGTFSKYAHPSLHFLTYGLALENSASAPDIFEHEALHCDRNFYSVKFRYMNPCSHVKYSPLELRAKGELSLADEIMAFMCTGREREYIKDTLRDTYMPSNRKFIKELNVKGQDANYIRKALQPTTCEIRDTVDAAFYLQGALRHEILVPLLFSICPPMSRDKLSKENLPFAEVRKWADMLYNFQVEPLEIIETLKKKGYCTNL